MSHVSCPAETSYALYTPQSGGLNDDYKLNDAGLLLVPAEAAAVRRRCSSLHTPSHSCGGQQNKLTARRPECGCTGDTVQAQKQVAVQQRVSDTHCCVASCGSGDACVQRLLLLTGL